MTKQFITVSLILDALRNERGASGAARMEEEAPKFLEWQEGFIVKPKNGGDTFKITRVVGGNAGKLTYQATAHLSNVDDPEETRQLRGPTLQSGYAFVSRGDVTDPAQAKKTTKPMTIATDTIRTFSPRKREQPGTRIVLKDGTSYVCVEDHDSVLRSIQLAQGGVELAA